MVRRTLPVLVALCMIAGCGKDASPTAPTNTTPPPTTTPPPAAPTRVTVYGVVRSSNGGTPVGGATVRIAGTTTTTDGNGYYSIPNIQVGAILVNVTANGYTPHSENFTVQGDWQYDVTLQFIPLVSRSGVGNTVFDIPVREMRLRIIGDFTGTGSNFIMWVGGRLAVNEIIGTRYPSTHYEGVHLVQGGVVEVRSSTGVAWSIQEVR